MEEFTNEILEKAEEVTVGQEEPYKSGPTQYIDSREVAEIVGKDHKKLLRDIRCYIKQIEQINEGQEAESNLGLSEFFVESSYRVEGQSRTYPCYLVTKKGCEFIAHKLTGLKGTKFTATYINRFHEMEEHLAGKTGAYSGNEGVIDEFIRRQEILNEKMMNCLDALVKQADQDPEPIPKLNPFAPERELFDRRLKSLSEGMDIATELSDVDKRTNLHYLYMTLEEELGISFDSYLAVYRAETGNKYACNLHVIASNDRIYNRAMEKIHNFIQRKRMFG